MKDCSGCDKELPDGDPTVLDRTCVVCRNAYCAECWDQEVSDGERCCSFCDPEDLIAVEGQQ